MSVCFGIYVGNTTCCVAVNRDDKVEIVANAAGDRVTPAVVAYHEGEVVTGMAAKQGMLRHGGSTVKGALRLIGCSSDDEVTSVGASCQPTWDNKHPVFNVQCGDTIIRVTPQKAIKSIFQLMKSIATSQSNEPEVVISLPAWANDSTISSIREAAHVAGFQVLSTISQPAAACLAYQLIEDNRDYFTGLVLHCGSSSSVASIIEVAGGLLTVKESTTTSTVAGDALTLVLVKHFAKEFQMKYKGDPMENRRSNMKLYNASENCKHVLSTMTTAQVHIDSLWEGMDLSSAMSRSRFDGLVSQTLTQILQPLKDLIHKCNLDISQINKIVLTGGTCKIPKLQQMIKDTFNTAEVLCHVSSDEALAYGAALEAGTLLGGSGNAHTAPTSLIPALAMPIYCKLKESKTSECVFSRCTPTHSRQSITLTANQSTSDCSVLIYEADQECLDPSEEQILAQVDFPDVKSESQLSLDFNLKSDGNLMVNIKDESKVNRSFIIEAGRS